MEAVGADADPAWFPTDGLVHLDLHTDNVLADDDGKLTGITDWDGACGGDPPRAYVAHHVLRCTAWAIRHRPEDVPRQFAQAERVLDRYEA